MELYAHSKEGEAIEGWQTLEEHLSNVACLSKRFASTFGCEGWGRAIGLLHDIGKAGDAFQRRIRGSSERADHSTAGARIAYDTYNVSQTSFLGGTLMAFAIAGHHGGCRTPL